MARLVLSYALLAPLAVAAPPGKGWDADHHGHSGDKESWSKGYCTFSTAPAPTSSSLATCAATRTTSYSSYTYTVETSTRYATPLPSPLKQTTTYAPPFSQASTLLPSNVTYTTYSLNPSATTNNDGPYGESAYAAMWASLTYNTTLPFTTTVSPTPVASSELVFPPALYTACPDAADSCIDCKHNFCDSLGVYHASY